MEKLTRHSIQWFYNLLETGECETLDFKEQLEDKIIFGKPHRNFSSSYADLAKDIVAFSNKKDCATNPDVAFDAAGPMRTVVGGVDLVAEHGLGRALSNNGALTIPANTTGNPAIALPAGLVRDMPVSLQVIGRHHAEQVLLDIGLALERLLPWPLVAPGAPH